MIRFVRLAARLVGLSSEGTHPRQLSLPFGGPSLCLASASAPPRRTAAAVCKAGIARPSRSFWISQDPHDSRRAAIGGTFAEVCAALECLAAQESRTRG
ncbi:hypothetical protein [Methylibium rhizosphaerae]|uniref:hypothetical protein n=1 Tax=Methylibium rhizosphaerae TaxID=2570323 RepID=UPI00112E8C3E|nr:hypothetical protein [Methylibium rhizosphaerae]